MLIDDIQRHVKHNKSEYVPWQKGPGQNSRKRSIKNWPPKKDRWAPLEYVLTYFKGKQETRGVPFIASLFKKCL